MQIIVNPYVVALTYAVVASIVIPLAVAAARLAMLPALLLVHRD